MTVAFVTTQNISASTVAGRVLPITKEISKHSDVVIYVMKGKNPVADIDGVKVKIVGEEPFIRTENGKIRLKGINLVVGLIKNTFQTFHQLIQDKPEIIVIVKPLPQNTLAVALARVVYSPKKIILDCDDFELTANVLTSIAQRAVIHVSERLACKISDALVAATPFLQDHLTYLTNNKKQISLIPTGLSKFSVNISSGEPQLLYAGSVSISSGHRVDMLIEIMKVLKQKHPQIKLHIAGDGDDVTTLKQAAQTQEVTSNIIWHGRFNEQSLTALLNTNTILIDPIDNSVVSRAKSSYRCMLAQSTGLPIVTSNIGIRSQILPVALHSRLVADPGNSQAYAQKIDDLLNEPLTEGEKNALQQNAKKYTWDTLAKEYWNILKIE